MIIKDEKGLARLVGELRAAGSFALDTEFIRERTYKPRLCLVQIATDDRAVIVDPLQLGHLDPLLELVFAPDIEKIVHSGNQDMEIFQGLGKRMPRNIVDTQVAAALVGRGERPSYARLVEELCGVRLGKGETFTDWAKRPLTPAQKRYALDDVRYLLPLIRALRSDLERLGRLEWLTEELQFYECSSTYEKNSEEQYRRVRGTAKLDRRELAVLRELAAWREEEAEQRDRPRGRVIQDPVLVELARRRPRSVDAIAAIRGVHPRLAKRSGRAIVERVRAALKLPDSACPPLPGKGSDESDLSSVVDLLEVVLRVRAAESSIAPSYLGNRRDLLELARRELGDSETGDGEKPLSVLQGWRRSLVGDALLSLLRERCSVRIDRERLRLLVEEL